MKERKIEIDGRKKNNKKTTIFLSSERLRKNENQRSKKLIEDRHI